MPTLELMLRFNLNSTPKTQNPSSSSSLGDTRSHLFAFATIVLVSSFHDRQESNSR
jgi:hypothetical protein